MRTKISSVAVVLVGTALLTVLPATAAVARPCADATDLGPAPTTAGGAVSVVSPEEWWTQTSSVTRTITLRPVDNGVDLVVRGGSCEGPVLCASAAPGIAAESCVVAYDGRIVVLAMYAAATPGATASGYTVSVAETPGAVPADGPTPELPSRSRHDVGHVDGVCIRTAT